MVLLDTCAVLDLCKPRPSLSKESLKRLDAGAAVLSVSFAEIACKIRLGKLVVDSSAKILYEQYRSLPTVRIIDIGCREWFDSIDLEWDHKDPADRLIVAYAKRIECPIATTDERIKKFYRRIIW